jgi:hypothetical protein
MFTRAHRLILLLRPRLLRLGEKMEENNCFSTINWRTRTGVTFRSVAASEVVMTAVIEADSS